MIDYVLIAALALLVFSKPVCAALRKRHDQNKRSADQPRRNDHSRERPKPGTTQDNNGT